MAIDGEIYQDAYLAPLKPESEIYLIPKSAAVELPKPRLRRTTPTDPGGIDARSPPLLAP